MAAFKIHEDVLEENKTFNRNIKNIVNKKSNGLQNRIPLRSTTNQLSSIVYVDDKENNCLEERKISYGPKQTSDSENTDIEEIMQIVNQCDNKETNHLIKVDDFVFSKHDSTFLSTKEYSENIFKYLLHQERTLRKPKYNYMTKQPELNFQMRSILVDWLCSVSEEYNLHTQTLHLAIQYIDCFLSRMSVIRSKFQLVGTAAMMIASKYEEIYPPSTNEWVYMTANSYTIRQILKMEQLILRVLSFDLSQPTLYSFIMHLCAVFEIPSKMMLLALYIAELVLLEGDEYLKHPPSQLAFASLALARHTLQEGDIWPSYLKSWTGYSLRDLSPLIKKQHKTFEDSPNKEQQSVQSKFRTAKYGRVSFIKPRRLQL